MSRFQVFYMIIFQSNPKNYVGTFQPPLEKNPVLHSQDPVLTFFVDITSTKLSLKHFPVPTSPTQSYHDNHTPAHQVTACHLILQFPLYLMVSYHHFLLLFNLSVCVLFISLRLSYHASRSSSDITVSVPLYFFLTSFGPNLLLFRSR